MNTARCIIVDDHEIIRYAIKKLFEPVGEIFLEVVGEADNGRTAVELVEALEPDVVIMEIALPEMNGIEATRHIKAKCPACRIVVLSMSSHRPHLRELIQLGISGYVHKSRALTDLPEAVGTALEGEVYLSPNIVQQMTADYAAIVAGKDERPSRMLSPRQREVLQLIVEGRGTKEIASLLNVSAKAIESVRHRIMQKLEIDNLADLTKYALREGLTTLDF